MIPRYEGPRATEVFSDRHRAVLMSQVTKMYMKQRVDSESVRERINDIGVPATALIAGKEREFGHDVVGFLHAFLYGTPKDLRPLVHVGLTSSDLTEYALHHQILEHASWMLIYVGDLTALELPNYPRAGRTHGQTAQITTLRHQFDAWKVGAGRLCLDFNRWVGDASEAMKSPGPTGLTPFVVDPMNTVPSTQVLPRDYLLSWAGLYLRFATLLENLALFVRLGARSELREFQEGAADNRIGSSAMPHKKNPIDSEKVTGLARLVRGYHLALSETAGALWEDRDLSNSSVERVAVADLAHVVEHMAVVMTDVMDNLVINENRVKHNAMQPEAWYSVYQTVLQIEAKVPFHEAADVIRMVSSKNWGSFPLARIDAQMRITEAYGDEIAKSVDVSVVAMYESAFNPHRWA